MNDLQKEGALLSKGSSSDLILHTVLAASEKLLDTARVARILDVGCGQGDLLKKLGSVFKKAELAGADLVQHQHFPKSAFSFFEHNCNHDFPAGWGQFDLITASEVIEHLENPRHFLRQIAQHLKPGGHAVLSTPNPESWASLISFILRGFFSAFGPRDYPAHITPVLTHQMENILSELKSLKLVQLGFVPNGRIPATGFSWQAVLPFLRGKRFSENYFVVIQRS